MESISILIRVLNEERDLETLLSQLYKQKYAGNVEIIVVDNESSDNSMQVAKTAGAKTETLTRDSFTYPKALNLAASKASGDLLVCISAHAEMLSSDWLSIGAAHFSDPNVVGVFGPQLAMRDAPIIEKIYYYIGNKRFRSARPIRRVGAGVMGASNCMIRSSYFEDHQFDESFASGGEDEAWARTAFSDGKIIIQDKKFVVRHSHRLGAINLIRQHRYWLGLKKPAEFSRKTLKKYRSDADYS